MTTMKPFLKWPGGKRWLINRYKHIFPKDYNIYIEPFLGGASVYFHMLPNSAVLSDYNSELISAYKVMRDNPIELGKRIIQHQRNHSKNYYYEIRDKKYRTALNRAAKLIYLNKTCFNGMYRVNSSGIFNVPKGSKDEFIYDIHLYEEYSEILNSAELVSGDFEETIAISKEGDFIFADPPYTVNHNKNGFLKYNEKLFSWGDQKRLAKSLYEAKNRGVLIIATNACFQELIDIYSIYGFQVHEVSRYSSISGKGEYRKQQKEIIVTNILDLEV